MSAGSSRLRKRSVSIAGHATSVSMEDAFWVRLTAIAKVRGVSVSRLIRDVDATREGNLSSALRVFILENTEPG
tara:strand:+ start:15454 stop:15675 length:222 start_codon:yes stop_codon:yes gene_type:complete